MLSRGCKYPHAPVGEVLDNMAASRLITASELEVIKREAVRHIDSMKDELCEISLALHSYAEAPFEEYRSSDLLVSALKENGFSVEKPFAGLETAFRGVYERGGQGPRIAFTAEYDAIRVLDYKSDRIMGHACGHNLNATASLGAALTVSRCLPRKVPGTVSILGTPGEEDLGRGGKLTLIDRGAFKNVDAAMMMHGTLYRAGAEHCFTAPHATYHLVSYIFHFKGFRPPDGPGVSALDPLSQFLQGLYVLEHRFGPDVAIRRIILRGGETPAAIPVETVAQVWIQSKSESLIKKAADAVKSCSEGCAQALGAEVEVEEEGRVKSVVCNPTLEKLVGLNAVKLGLKWKDDAPLSPFSTDFGNVTAVVPSLYLKVPLGVGRFHTSEAITSSKSEQAHEGMINATKLLSIAAIDLFASPALLSEAKNELRRYQKTKLSSGRDKLRKKSKTAV